MSGNDPNERASDAERFGSFASPNPYSPDSPGLDDLYNQYNQYNPDDPMRPQPPRAEWSITLRQITSVVIFIVGAGLFSFLLLYANLRYKLNLTHPLFGAQLGGLSWFTAINFCVLLAFWIILKRLGVFPRMPGNTRRDDSRWRE